MQISEGVFWNWPLYSYPNNWLGILKYSCSFREEVFYCLLRLNDRIQGHSFPYHWIIYSYPMKERWIVVGKYRDAKRRRIYPPLFTDPEGDSCFSIYQIRWIKERFFNLFFWNFRKTTRSQNSEYPRIFQVMGANQNVRKLLSTDLVKY